MIRNNMTILFYGDSITDTDRLADPTNPWGRGYVSMVNSDLLSVYPNMNIKVINKGNSGNRAIDLVNRLDKDVIANNPDILFILIGVNDAWRKYDANDETPKEVFKKHYETIIKKVKKHNKDVQIVLFEPFLLHDPIEREKYREDLNPKIKEIKKLAKKYNLTYILLDSLFKKLAKKIPSLELAYDGIHPTTVGHAFIAREALKVIKQ